MGSALNWATVYNSDMQESFVGIADINHTEKHFETQKNLDYALVSIFAIVIILFLYIVWRTSNHHKKIQIKTIFIGTLCVITPIILVRFANESFLYCGNNSPYNLSAYISAFALILIPFTFLNRRKRALLFKLNVYTFLFSGTLFLLLLLLLSSETCVQIAEAIPSF